MGTSNSWWYLQKQVPCDLHHGRSDCLYELQRFDLHANLGCVIIFFDKNGWVARPESRCNQKSENFECVIQWDGLIISTILLTSLAAETAEAMWWISKKVEKGMVETQVRSWNKGANLFCQ